MLVRRRLRRGFTLVELATVVVIVGVLSVIAVVGYRRHVRTSHLAEATDMTKSIRAAQEAHKAETGLYADISNDATSYYPAANPGPFVTAWGGPCGVCKDPKGWKAITVEASGPVMFGYATVAGIGASTIGSSSGGSSGGGSSGMQSAMASSSGGSSGGSSSGSIGPSQPFYSTVAYGDPDGDGQPTKVLGFSQTGQLMIEGE